MAHDRFPAAARGDAHALVVVTDRTAGGERIVEPETVRAGDAVGDVGERRGALVGGDDEIRVVAVVADHALGRNDLSADDVVGDVQQAVDEAFVTGHALVEPCIAIDRRIRQLLAEEAALGAHRHDDGVLDHLRLDQPQHFGAEVLAAVGPAQTAARDRAEAQMHAFDARSADEDFAIRAGLGQIRHFGRVELEAEIVGRAAVGALAVAVRQVIVGAQRGFDHADEAAQDAVLIETRDAIEQGRDRLTRCVQLRLALAGTRCDHRLDRCRHCGIGARERRQLTAEQFHAALDVGLALGAGDRIEARFEQLDQETGDDRVARECSFDIALRKRNADLQQILAVSPQQRHLTPRQVCGEDQPVEAVVFGIAPPDLAERILEAVVEIIDVDVRAADFHFEILDESHTLFLGGAVHLQPVRVLGDDPQAHVLHHRQRVRQRDVVMETIELEAQAAVLIAAQAQAQIVLRRERCDLFDVVGGDRGGYLFDVTGRQCAAILVGERQPAFLAVTRHQLVAQIVLPVAHDRRELRVDLLRVDPGRIRFDRLALPRTHQHVQLRERGIAQLDGGIDAVGVQDILEHRFDAQAHFGVVPVAGYVRQHRIETSVSVVAQEHAAAHALLQAEDAGSQLIELLLRRLEQFVARQFFEDVAQRFAAVARRMQAGGFHHVIVTFADQRNFPRAAGVGAGGVKTDEALLADRAAVRIEAEHADVIHVTGAMYGGAGVGLGQDQGIGRPRLRHGMRGQRGEFARLTGFPCAQQAQAGARFGCQHFLAAVAAHAVFAIAKKREVIVRGPAQELLHFLAAGIADRHLAVTDIGGDVQHLLAHGRPVLDDPAHVAQHGEDGLFDIARIGRGLAVDFQMHHRLDRALADRSELAAAVARNPDHRMPQHVHTHAAFGQRHRHRIDQERHVVVDDLQHRVRGFPAMLGPGGIEQADAGCPGLAIAREVEEIVGQRCPAIGTVHRHFIFGHAQIERCGERAGIVLADLARALADGVEDRIEQRGLDARRFSCGRAARGRCFGGHVRILSV